MPQLNQFKVSLTRGQQHEHMKMPCACNGHLMEFSKKPRIGKPAKTKRSIKQENQIPEKKQHIFEPYWKKVLFYSAVLTDDEGMVEIKQAVAIPNEDVTSEVARIRSQLCFNYLKINFR
jgi:hypothetical protein